ncbi:sugar 3,4-ketoisomerase [Mongoliitalea lutea]|uniref:Sugar 3,4-ketoisomerase QdtA cupin domain-containing protein n=1 Tax=Mongoliitalea lutea TaxID=849756 RepID=A0A8J3CVU8_9BACT|nr:FdtA/QdtA family cupin domain-containing protein [Mongoliitalea lutea]GHB31438.1 hypothetical protein GCM10008106_10250 [Mongoliitalea lutea]
MKTSTIFDCSVLDLKKINNFNGRITAVNNLQEVPFEIKRIFYLYDIPSGVSRGQHAHISLHQVILASTGSFDVIVDDGKMKRTFYLNQPNTALHVPPGIWAELVNFSGGSICMVLASDIYEEDDYLRDYKDFLNYKNTHN